MGNLRWLGLLLVVSCAGELDGGEVYDKSFQAAYDTTYTSCHEVGKNSTVCYPVTTHHEATYWIDIQAC